MLTPLDSLWLAPWIALIALHSLLSALVGAWGWASLQLSAPLALGGLAAAYVTAVAGLEIAARRRAALQPPPRWVVQLDTVAFSARLERRSVGGKAHGLGRLRRLGLPVPDGIVLTTELAQLLRSARQVAGQSAWQPRDFWRALPEPARKKLRAFLSRCAGGKVVVRASFADESADLSYAGLFPAVRDVDSAEPELVALAVLAVLDSAASPAVTEYRRRCGTRQPLATAVLIQQQIECEVMGVAQSRMPDGSADSTLVDYVAGRTRTRSVRYDLVDRRTFEVTTREEIESPVWLRRVSMIALALDSEVGDTVQLEFGVAGGQLFVFQTRRVRTPLRQSWLHSEKTEGEVPRLPRLAGELRGSVEPLREAMGRVLRAAGTEPPRQEELRNIDGSTYVNVQVLRRLVASQASNASPSAWIRRLRWLVAPVPAAARPPPPDRDDEVARSWARLRQWYDHTVRTRARLVARAWLIEGMLGRLTVDPDRRHPIRHVLERRTAQCRAQAESMSRHLAEADNKLVEHATTLLARTSSSWNTMFLGEKALHAGMDELELGTSDFEALDRELSTRRDAFLGNASRPLTARDHDPPLPPPPAPARGRYRAVGIVAGVARGTACLVSKPDVEIPPDCIAVLPDGRIEYRAHVFSAEGLILLGGGVLTPVAALAADLGVPTVLVAEPLPSQQLRSGNAALDGEAGVIQLP